MSNTSRETPEQVKVMATIGHICLQWARLEMGILCVIYTIEDMSMEKGEIIFGGLDILPRINMAIKLAEHAKLPLQFARRLKAIRKQLQDGLCDRRNQAVHGAHRDEADGKTTITMVRWRGAKREEKFDSNDLHKLGVEILDLGSQCWDIMDDLTAWKLRRHGKKDLRDAVG